MASLGQLSTQDGQGGQDESGCSEPLALASKNEGEPRQVSDEPISNSSSTNGSSDRVDPIPGKPRDQSVAKEEDDDDGGVANEDGGAETSTSSQGSRAGYTADCSSDASSDLSASTKKKAKDNIILPVKNLSIKDTNIDTDDCSENDSSGMSLATGPEKDNFTGQQTRRNDRQKRHRRKRSDDKTAKSFDSVSSASSDSRQPPVQLNGVQIVHPMDPRIDIRRVGYIHEQPDVPHGRQQQQQQQHLPASDHTDNAPSLENYLQLMEVRCVDDFVVHDCLCRLRSCFVLDALLNLGDPRLPLALIDRLSVPSLVPMGLEKRSLLEVKNLFSIPKMKIPRRHRRRHRLASQEKHHRGHPIVLPNPPRSHLFICAKKIHWMPQSLLRFHFSLQQGSSHFRLQQMPSFTLPTMIPSILMTTKVRRRR